LRPVGLLREKTYRPQAVRRLEITIYNVTTGSTISSSGYGVTSYAAKIADGKILVAVT
jgi:hypothetical protein